VIERFVCDAFVVAANIARLGSSTALAPAAPPIPFASFVGPKAVTTWRVNGS
jgi:hypothetical protein